MSGGFTTTDKVRGGEALDRAVVGCADPARSGLAPPGFHHGERTVAYYNEIDPFAAAWLRELIKQGHIAPGVVDERDIRDVRPADLAGFVQCHFFAGIGVWSYALRRAGWPDDRPVWTASLPCQPWSDAGAGGGFDDERHLWPCFNALRLALRPVVCVGEQVASKAGLAWLDAVQADVEASGDAFGAIDLCSAGFGAPHIRQRLHWLAVTESECGGAGLRDLRQAGDGPALDSDGGAIRWLADANGGNASAERKQRGGQQRQLAQDGGAIGVADSSSGGQPIVGDAMGQGRGGHVDRGVVAFGLVDAGSAGPSQFSGRRIEPARSSAAGAAGGLDNPLGDGRGARGYGHNSGHVWQQLDANVEDDRPGPTNGLWRAADWLFCRDGKWRPVEPGTFPLAHGAPARVGRLRCYGNAINAEVATAFVEAVIECLADRELREAA